MHLPPSSVRSPVRALSNNGLLTPSQLDEAARITWSQAHPNTLSSIIGATLERSGESSGKYRDELAGFVGFPSSEPSRVSRSWCYLAVPKTTYGSAVQ